MTFVLVLAFAGALSATAAPLASAAQTASGVVSMTADSCGASKYQWLLGKLKSAIPAPPQGARWRIYSTNQVVTMDYVEGRMDIVWDAKTEIVKSVTCG